MNENHICLFCRWCYFDLTIKKKGRENVKESKNITVTCIHRMKECDYRVVVENIYRKLATDS